MDEALIHKFLMDFGDLLKNFDKEIPEKSVYQRAALVMAMYIAAQAIFRVQESDIKEARQRVENMPYNEKEMEEGKSFFQAYFGGTMRDAYDGKLGD